MARFRTFDPIMRSSPQLDGLSLLALVVLHRLIQEADDEGRQFGDGRSVWSAVFPRNNAPDGVTIESVVMAVGELIGRRVLLAYEVDGQSYLVLPGWRDGDSWQYQYVSHPIRSRHPAPPGGTVVVRERSGGRLPAGQIRSVSGLVLSSADLNRPDLTGPDLTRPDRDGTGKGAASAPAGAASAAPSETQGLPEKFKDVLKRKGFKLR